MTLPSPSLVIQAAIQIEPRIVEHLSGDALKIVKAAGYDGIRTVMHGAIFGSVFGYLETGGRVADFRERMATAVSKAYIETADLAYQEAGAELPLDDETAAWAREQLNAQLAYIDGLFEDLREVRRGEYDAGTIANARADGYSRSLDSFFSEVKMRGSKNVTLEFTGSDGKENCATCKRLKGKRHKISYILDNDLVPYPGNQSFECQCYNCEHFWFNPKTGEEFRP
jgi:hypothetical protein